MFLLVLLTLVFVSVLVNVIITRPITENTDTRNSSKQKLELTGRENNTIVGYLTPADISVNSAETFVVKLSFENITAPIVATDIVLEYDNNLVEFIETSNLDPNYIVPKTDNSNGQLTVSLVKKLNTNISLDQVNLVDLVFKAIKPGKLTISPVLKISGKTSMVYVENLDEDQLQSINSIFIKIN